LKQWGCYDKNKAPINPQTGGYANADTPATWGSYDDSVTAMEKYSSCRGIGFQFETAPEYTLRVSGIDLYHVIREDGTIEPFAASIVELMNFYTELSPRGTGLHILCFTQMENIGKNNRRPEQYIEMYNHRHYFTIIGKIYGEPVLIQERTLQFRQVYEQYFQKTDVGVPARLIPFNGGTYVNNVPDKELWNRMFQSKNGAEILDLYNGKTGKYSYDDSRADLALCSYLAYCTGCNTEQMDRMFKSSGLIRPKWNEKHSIEEKLMER